MTIKHLFPTAKPTVDFNFAAARQLDPRITFTRSSIGTYVDEDGILQYAAVDEPRFDHDGATGESLGLLIEEARTNDTYPSTFDGTPGTWRYTNYVKPDQTTAPDGTNTGALLDFEMDSPTGNLNFDSGTPQVSGTRSFSFWCKTASPGSGTVMNLRMVGWTFADGNTGTRTYTFNFDTKTKDTADGDGSDFEVQPYPNGWYRCMISNLRDGGFLSFRIDKNPQNWYIWGMQSEEGTFCTSYIPASGATADRSKDIAEVTSTDLSQVWQRHVWTAIWEFQGNNSYNGFNISNGENRGDRSHVQTFLNSGNINLGGRGILGSDGPVWSKDTRYKIGVGIDTDAVTGSGTGTYVVNGELMTTKDITTPSNRVLEEIRFYGGNLSEDRLINGHYLRAALYPRLLTPEQMQALTA